MPAKRPVPAIPGDTRRGEQGDADAQYKLARMYAKGEGVPEDDAEAVKWFRKAAEQGHAESQFLLGAMYALGEGVLEDDVEVVPRGC